MKEQTTNHKEFVELEWVGDLFSGPRIIKEIDKENYLLIDYTRPWNGEFYIGTPCDRDGKVEGKPRDVEIFPVQYWNEHGEFVMLGYSYSRPMYPQISWDLLP